MLGYWLLHSGTLRNLSFQSFGLIDLSLSQRFDSVFLFAYIGPWASTLMNARLAQDFEVLWAYLVHHLDVEVSSTCQFLTYHHQDGAYSWVQPYANVWCSYQQYDQRPHCWSVCRINLICRYSRTGWFSMSSHWTLYFHMHLPNWSSAWPNEHWISSWPGENRKRISGSNWIVRPIFPLWSIAENVKEKGVDFSHQPLLLSPRSSCSEMN